MITTYFVIMGCAIALIGIAMGVCAWKICAMMDVQDDRIEVLRNKIERLEADLNYERDIRREAIDQAKEETAAAVKKEAALRQKEIESHKAETYLALYGRCGYDGESFCGIPVVDPKNKPWTAQLYKWTFGDEHGTK